MITMLHNYFGVSKRLATDSLALCELHFVNVTTHYILHKGCYCTLQVGIKEGELPNCKLVP